MSAPLAILGAIQVAGSVLGYFGQRSADKAQAAAERANAAFFEAQARLAEMQTARELDIFSRQSEAVIGSQINALASSGIAFTGSAVNAVVQANLAAGKEKAAIELAGREQVKLARMRADSAESIADALSSRGPSQAIAAILGVATGLTRAGVFGKLKAKDVTVDDAIGAREPGQKLSMLGSSSLPSGRLYGMDYLVHNGISGRQYSILSGDIS